MKFKIQGTAIFFPEEAGWTKQQISERVESCLEGMGEEPKQTHLNPMWILDSEAEEFVAMHYDWLDESIEHEESEAYGAEAEWIDNWYHKVMKRISDERSKKEPEL